MNPPVRAFGRMGIECLLDPTAGVAGWQILAHKELRVL